MVPLFLVQLQEYEGASLIPLSPRDPVSPYTTTMNFCKTDIIHPDFSAR